MIKNVMNVNFDLNLMPLQHSPANFYDQHVDLLNPIENQSLNSNMGPDNYTPYKLITMSVFKSFLGLDFSSLSFSDLQLDPTMMEEMLNTLQGLYLPENAPTLREVPPMFQQIANTHYLSHLISTDELAFLLFQFYTNLADIHKENVLLLLKRADGGFDDALFSHLDNMFAMKKDYAKDNSFYDKSLEEILDPYLSSVFNVFAMLGVEQVGGKHDWTHVTPYQNVSNLIHINIVDLVLFSKILDKSIPKGYIKFSLTPETGEKSLDQLKLRLNFYKQQFNIQEIFMQYNPCNQDVNIQSLNYKNSQVRFEIDNGRIQRLQGTLSGKPLNVFVSEKKYNQDFESIQLGEWEAQRLESYDGLEEGYWVNAAKHTRIPFHAHVHVYENKSASYMVVKSMALGDTEIMVSYIYRKGCPVPVAAVGVLKVI